VVAYLHASAQAVPVRKVSMQAQAPDEDISQVLRTVRDMRSLFDSIANRETSLEIFEANHSTTEGRSDHFPPDVLAETYKAKLLFLEKAKPLIDTAERYGIRADALDAMYQCPSGRQNGKQRSDVRRLLRRLEIAVLKAPKRPRVAVAEIETPTIARAAMPSSAVIPAQPTQLDPPPSMMGRSDIRAKYKGHLDEGQLHALFSRLGKYEKKPNSRSEQYMPPGKTSSVKRWPAEIIDTFAREIIGKRTDSTA
jgi:hypothetical protein